MPAPDIILSICIPTFNRASLLQQTLESMVQQATFADSDDVEIVISDNCSEDDTPEVGARYAAAYPDKIRYHRLEQAIPGDQNFRMALSKGHGQFLKLHNDNLQVRPGGLAELVKVIRATAAEQPIIFCTNGNMRLEQPVEAVAGLDDFVRRVSYFSTWIGGFGIWRQQFEAITDFNRSSHLQLVQADVVLRQVAAGKRVIILYETYFAGMPVNKKGGYNVAKVFGQNYLSLLKEYVARGALSDSVYQAEKKRILIHHIIPYHFTPDNGFLKDEFFVYMQDYLHDAYFYQAIAPYQHDVPMPPALSSQPAPAPAPAPAAPPAVPDQDTIQLQLKALWRARNAHNETVLSHAYGNFNFDKVSVGRRSYGGLTVWTFGCGDEGLKIGHFVSIADDVKFLLGGNHGYRGVSTFPFLAKYFGTAEAGTKGPIVIGDDVWIGFNSTILSGVTIGQGAIVAAGSMVTGDVAPYSIVGGNPASFIKFRFEPAVIDKLAALDYAQVSDQAILRNRETLGTALTPDNVDAVIAALTGP